MVIDEYQHVINVSDCNRINDMEFFSLSREYKNINVIATQSISSLESKGNVNAISSLTGNCMTKILLQCSDYYTNTWAKNLFEDANISLKLLKKGECYIETINKDGGFIDKHEKIHFAYQKTKKILETHPDKSCIHHRKTPMPYRLGAGLFPYIISDILMSYTPVQTKAKKVKFDYNEYEEKLYNELIYLRDLSRSGVEYWKKHTTTNSDIDLVPTNS